MLLRLLNNSLLSVLLRHNGPSHKAASQSKSIVRHVLCAWTFSKYTPRIRPFAKTCRELGVLPQPQTIDYSSPLGRGHSSNRPMWEDRRRYSQRRLAAAGSCPPDFSRRTFPKSLGGSGGTNLNFLWLKKKMTARP